MAMFIGLGGLGVGAAVVAIVRRRSAYSPVLVIVLFSVFFAAMLYQMYAIRCPRCKGNLGRPLLNEGGPFLLSRRVRFCLCCGIDLDSAVSGQPNSPLEPSATGGPLDGTGRETNGGRGSPADR